MIVLVDGDRCSFLLFLLLCINVCVQGAVARSELDSGDGNKSTIRCIESERQALLAFKEGLVDPQNGLSSWSSQDQDCCRWKGISCDNQTGHVLMLNISHLLLDGEIGSSLLALPYLTHLYLNFNNFQNIPPFVGLLRNLTYLDLSANKICGTFPYHLTNLSMLQYLDLSWNYNMTATNLDWLTRLSKLTTLKLSSVDFVETRDWLQPIKMHPSLSTLELRECQFPDINPSTLSTVNSSKSLTALYLIGNTFKTSINVWLFYLSSALVDLVIFDSYLKGPIPDSIGNLTLLQNLDLSINDLEGGLPTSFGNLCHLKTLYLGNNKLSASLDNILKKLTCAKNSLEILYLYENQITGSIPHKIFEFKYLSELDLGNNRLTGSLMESVQELSNLTVLDLSSNSLHGIISEANLSMFPKLQHLYLSDNIFALNISSDWIPPFQLKTIGLGSCKLGPNFPRWLQHQKEIASIDLSYSGISDVIPSWIWNLSSTLQHLNLSFNQMRGQVPNVQLKFSFNPAIDLSSNLLHGLIPQFLSDSGALNLSKNRFSGSISFLCSKTLNGQLTYLDLSHNLLSGGLTDCWGYLKRLVILNLGSNNLSGIIPSTMGLLTNIETLSLRNNSLTGGLPASLVNCTRLKLLDVGENSLTNEIPMWIGTSLTDLIVLRLQSNQFYGGIASTICHLSSLQVLDLSFNNLTRAIPNCLNNLTAMVSNQPSEILEHSFFHDSNGKTIGYADSVTDSAWVVWKGVEREYGKTLNLLKIIDLSRNSLVGGIPSEVTALLGLISLNVSRNHLDGQIPVEIGKMKLLDALDLSHNRLSGKIPSSLADMSLLNNLDLSDNKLTGRIPRGTQLQSFGVSSYMSNPGLCGCPLSTKCPGERNECQDDTPVTDKTEYNITGGPEELFDRTSVYAGMGVGFAVGFFGFCGALIASGSWRHTYYQFLSDMWVRLCLIVVQKVARRGLSAAR